jgi:pentatricopeptide repeat protein
LNMWVQQGKADKAGEVVKEMRAAGHEPNVVTYSSLINLWAKSPTPWRFREVLDEMVRTGIRPDVFSFSPLIARFARDEDMTSIRKIFDGMAHHGVKPNLFSYNCALQGASSLNDRQAGTAILKMMTARDESTDRHCSKFRPPLDCSHLPQQQQEHRRK